MFHVHKSGSGSKRKSVHKGPPSHEVKVRLEGGRKSPRWARAPLDSDANIMSYKVDDKKATNNEKRCRAMSLTADIISKVKNESQNQHRNQHQRQG